MPAPEFAILGPLEVRRDGGLVDVRGGLPRALLLVLLVHANERVASERLIDELWGETPPADAANALQVHVSRVRRALGAADALITVAGGYRLRVDPGALDATLFEAELEAARVALAAGMAREAEATLNQALARWRGPALADCTYHAFAQGEIARLEELRLSALEELMEAQLAQDRRRSPSSSSSSPSIRCASGCGGS
jgi:DNA-binding SARP family transcriptional activator